MFLVNTPLPDPGEFHGRERELAFFTGLRALTHLGLCLVTASRVPLINLVSGHTRTSPFFNVFFPIILDYFEQKEAEHFVQAKGTQGALTHDEQQAMLRYGKQGKSLLCSPLKLQLIGEHLLDSKTNGRIVLPSPNARSWQALRQELDEIYQGMAKS